MAKLPISAILLITVVCFFTLYCCYRCGVDNVKEAGPNPCEPQCCQKTDPPTSITTKIDGVDADSVVWVDGQTKTVTCEAIGGSPTPTVALIRDGTELVSGTGSVSRDIAQTRSMNPVVIQCEATNVAIDNPITDQTTINVLYPPSSGPDITGYTGQVLTEGVPPTTVTVTCTVGEASPVPTLTWNCPAGSSSTGSNTRVISINRSIDGVTCTCSGSQSGTGWTGVDSVTFTVHYGPDRAEITGNTRVLAGTQMTLTCTATSYSPGVTYQWTKKGVDVGVSSGTYRFTPSAADNNAEVVCVAKNSQHLNKQTQHSVTLDILYSPASEPVITGYSTGTVLVEVPQTTVRLQCAVGVANPEAYLAWDSNYPNGNDAKSTRKISRTINVSRGMNGVICTCSGSQSGTVWTGADSITFTVHYGPDHAEITGNTRVLSSTQMTLTCTATSYSPGVTFQWTKKGVDVGVSSGTYQFTPQVADDNAEVVCVAKNSQHLNQQAQHSVTLDILYSPPSGPEITGLSGLVLVEGRSPTTVTLTCTVGIANPDRLRKLVFYGTSNTSIQAPKVVTEGDDVTISCSSIDNPIPTYTITGPGSRHTSVQNTLKITDIDRSDSGQYSCTAVNIYNDETQTADVTVQYPPDVSVTYTNMTEGETGVLITCGVTGEPPTYDFSLWKHIGPDEHTDLRHLPGKQNGGQFTLTLNDPITYEDSGYYTCIVNNGIKGRSQQINQTKISGYFVVEGPQKILTHDNLIHGNLGQEVDLVVEFYSVPGFTSVSWYSHDDGKQISGDTHTEITNINTVFYGVEVQVQGYRTSLTLSNVTESDFRSYRVEVGNTIGSASFGLTLHGITDPCAARHLFIDTLTSTSVTVMWSPGCNGGADQKFYVQHRKSTGIADDKWETGSPVSENDTPVYTITGLDPDTGYHIKVMSRNEKGRTYTEYTGEPVVETQTGPIVGGVMCVVVIVAVGLVIFVMWRKGLLNKGGLSCLQGKTDSDGVYQNQAFSPENQSKM
ncbi:hypothetical protein ScPMuIL_002986 [Solemya velum]